MMENRSPLQTSNTPAASNISIPQGPTASSTAEPAAKTNDSFDKKKIEGLVDAFISSEDAYVKDSNLDELTEDLFNSKLTLEQQKTASKILGNAISSDKYNSELDFQLEGLKANLDYDMMVKEETWINKCLNLVKKGKFTEGISNLENQLFSKLDTNKKEKVLNLLFHYLNSPLNLHTLSVKEHTHLKTILCSWKDNTNMEDCKQSLIEIEKQNEEILKSKEVWQIM